MVVVVAVAVVEAVGRVDGAHADGGGVGVDVGVTADGVDGAVGFAGDGAGGDADVGVGAGFGVDAANDVGALDAGYDDGVGADGGDGDAVGYRAVCSEC